ncbi:NAD(P)/FAD-dependent oxidoreductase [Prolixibacteraceae bacterium Z1-6]|uniref:NAD(P)/FAD-dependent oxidoreductase n=1 Tax=Draconibacterium aestuarii TaxID=2998507 RepID=A0A9X3J8K5_9BACT|nr:NAD(P)/FAD-dependent oxidoreductase [Prolixibacteraceae bacterium Z1-6]
MGYKTITLKLPTDYSNEQLKSKISKELRVKDFDFQIENKSLDARKKSNIYWLVKVAVSSPEIKNGEQLDKEELEIPYKKRYQKIVVVGSGPAGFFAAFTLQKAGFQVTLLERGSEVKKRSQAISGFERGGVFDPKNNYAFGEGGAGTFSDGKLTSRSKRISKEKQFILSSYVEAGAPEEIMYMAHPHLGTDNLRKIVKNLRIEFENTGGEILFETMLEDILIVNNKVKEVRTSAGNIQADALFIATGHSAYETYKMLIKNGIPFRTKNFAIGSRMEHRQEIINSAQWGHSKLPGVKAAEYRVTSPADGKHQVFSFCMCPGGTVVPAAAYENTNIVNGMSYYQRNGKFANAACVAGIHPDELAGKTVSPIDALNNLQKLEEAFYNFSNSYSAPACSISDFLKQKSKVTKLDSSYPLGLTPAPLWELLPQPVVLAMQAGLLDFNRKIRGFETGNLLGFESKTSSPIQVIREKNGLVEGFENLYMIGEGSGYAGGIISSAADGIKAAMSLVVV